MAELIKFMKIRNIFKTNEHKLMFPLSHPFQFLLI
jgi:hypothetical protein